MGDEDSINVSVVADAAACGGLPEHRIIVLRWDPCEVRVFEVYEEPTLLTKITIENVPYHFCGTLAPFNHRRTIGRNLQNKAINGPDSVLAQALRVRE